MKSLILLIALSTFCFASTSDISPDKTTTNHSVTLAKNLAEKLILDYRMTNEKSLFKTEYRGVSYFFKVTEEENKDLQSLIERANLTEQELKTLINPKKVLIEVYQDAEYQTKLYDTVVRM